MSHDAPPQARMLGMIIGSFVSQALYVAAKLGIADLLGKGPKDSKELAAATATHAPSLYRLLRALGSVGVLSEDANGRFTLTPLGETLQVGKMREFAILMGAPFHWRVWEETLHAIQTGKPSFEKVHGQPAFEWLSKNPEPAQIFDGAMTSFTTSLLPAIVGAYDFSGIGKLVDVGGGHGALLCAVLKASPKTSGVIYDLPHVIEGARKRIADEKLEARCQIVNGDFFASVPPADAYLMKHIIHDWDDEKALTILKNCRKAMAKGGRVLLVEGVVPPGDAPSFDKLLDLEMLLFPAGRERTEAEFRELFRSADLELTKLIPTPSPVCLLEARAR